MDLADRQKRAREEARNNIETYVYKMQDYLYDSTIELVSTQEQRGKFLTQLSETSEWLYGDGEGAQTTEFVQKLEELKYVFRRGVT